jgi:heterotetrameric sarcosine oxidase gamma subunit
MNAASTPISRSPLHHWHALHGARFADAHGWQVPICYSTVEREFEAGRDGVGIADISAFAKFSVVGPKLANELAANPRHVTVFDAEGPALACRLRPDQLLILTTTTDQTGIRDRLANDFHCVLTDVTSAFAGFCVIGPGVLDFLRGLTPLNLSESAFPIGSCAETSLAGVHALLVKPPTQTRPVVRIYVAWDVAEYIWERILIAGHILSIFPIGLDALAALRHEPP